MGDSTQALSEYEISNEKYTSGDLFYLMK